MVNSIRPCRAAACPGASDRRSGSPRPLRLFLACLAVVVMALPASAAPWWWAQFTDGVFAANTGIARWYAFGVNQAVDATDTAYVCSYTWSGAGTSIASIDGINGGNTAGLNAVSAAGGRPSYLIGDGDGGAGLANAQALSDANVTDVTEPAGGAIMHIKDFYVAGKGWTIASGNHTSAGWGSQRNNFIYFRAAQFPLMEKKVEHKMYQMARGLFHSATPYGTNVFYSPYGDTVELRYSPNDNDGSTVAGTGSIIGRLRQLAQGAKESIFYMSDAWSTGAGQLGLIADFQGNTKVTIRGCGGAGTDWGGTNQADLEALANGTHRNEAGASNKLHSKTFIFDMEWVATGSANMTGAATSTAGSNDEAYVLVHDFRLARRYMTHYHQIMAAATADPSADKYDAAAPAGATALNVTATDTAFYAAWTPSATTDVSRYYIFIDTAALTQVKIGDGVDADADGYIDEDPRGDYDGFKSGAVAPGTANDDDADGASDEDLWMAPEVMVKGRASTAGAVRTWNVGDTLLNATNYYFGVVSVDTQGNEGPIATFGPIKLGAVVDTRLTVQLNSTVSDTNGRRGDTGIVAAHVFVRGETGVLQDTLTIFAVKNLGTSDSRDMTVRLWRDEDSNARLSAADTMLAQLIYSNTTRRYQTTFLAGDSRVRLGTAGKTFLVTVDVFDSAGLGETFQAQIDARTCSSPRRDSGPAAIVTNPGRITFIFVDTTPPNAFNLSSPPDLTETRATSLTLRWADALDDSSPPVLYELQVDTSGTFVSNVLDTTGLVDTFHVTALRANDTYFWRVIARDNEGNARASSATRRIIVDTQPPAAGTLIAPPSPTDTSLTTVTFRWNAASDTGSGIFGYRLQVDTANTFIAPLVDSATPLLTGAQSLPANDTYYWRILAVDDAGNTRSTTANLLRVDTGGPVVGTLSSPAANLDTSSTTIRFSWTTSVDSVTRVTGYRLQIDTANTFVAPFIDSATPLLSGSRTLPVNDTYYWRVVAIDSVLNTSAHTARRLRIDTTTPPPVGLITKRGDTFTSVVPLAWVASQDSISGLSFYIVQVDTSGAFTSLKDSATHWAGDTLHLFSLPMSDTYFWRVLAYDSAGNYSKSLPLLDSFVTLISDTQPPATFNLTAPPDITETRTSTIILRWQDALDSASNPVRYRVQIDTSASFASPYFDSSGLLDTFISAPFRVNETSSWRVVATDNSGNTRAVNAARRMVVDTTGPTSPSLIAPSSAHDTRVASITFRWSSAADTGTGLNGYRLQIDTSNSFIAPFIDSSTPLTTGARLLPANDTYFWRAVSVDDVGNTTAAAPNLIRIDTTPPQVGALATPATPHDTTAAAIAFTWTAAADTLTGVAAYRLQVDTSPSFLAPSVDSATILTFGSRALSANDSYYWRVVAVDNAGNTTAYAASLVRIDTTGPTSPVSLSPALQTDTTNTSVTFAWSTAIDTGVGGVTYGLQIDADGLFAPSLIDTVTSASSLVVALPANEIYFWRVLSIDGLGNATPNAPRILRVDTAPPTQVLLSGFNGDSTTPALTLAWFSASDSVTAVRSYVVQVDTSGLFTSLVESATTAPTATNFASSIVTTDTYFWRVLAFDSVGNFSISAADSFLLVRTDTVTPSAFALTAPDDRSNTTAVSIAFRWGNSLDDTSPPVRYNLQVDTSGLFAANLVDTSWLTDTFATLTLAANDTYYWRVIARDNSQNTTASASIFRFAIDTAPPSIPVLDTLDGDTTRTSPVYLRWAASTDSIAGLAGYLLQLDTTITFTAPLGDSLYLAASDTDYFTATLPPDTWYWRVFAVDSVGNVSAASIDSFVILIVETRPPVIFSVTASPSSVSNAGPTAVTFTVTAFDSSYVASVLIHLAGVGGVDSAGFTPATPVPSSDSLWTLTHTFDSTVAGGNYTLTVTAIDASNNASTTTVTVAVADASPTLAPLLDTPIANIRAGGNELSVVSVHGETYAQVLYQFRYVPSGSWMTCTPSALSVTNPDTQGPFWGFFWDISALPDSAQFDVRAVGTDRFGVTDPNPGFARITIAARDSNVNEYRSSTSNLHIRRQLVRADTIAQIVIAEGTGLDVPIGAISDSVWIRVTVHDTVPSGTVIPQGFVIPATGTFREFTREDGGRSFLRAMTLTLPYGDSDALNDEVAATSTREADLAIYRFDELFGAWVKEATSQVDPVRNVVTASVDHFTIFAVLAGAPAAAGLQGVVVYPNPFVPYDGVDRNGKAYDASDPTSGILFDSLPAQVTIDVHDVAGRRVATMSKASAFARYQWDAHSDDGREIASGVYIAVIRSPTGEQIVRKIMVVR
jgi:hypothetical protein